MRGGCEARADPAARCDAAQRKTATADSPTPCVGFVRGERGHAQQTNTRTFEEENDFSSLLRDLGIPYPKFGAVHNAEEAVKLSRELGFPLLVRPSYVLGGQKMKIVINEEELVDQVLDILRLMPDNKILIDHFLDGAIEAESDSICDGEMVRIIGIMEHDLSRSAGSSLRASTAATATPCSRPSTSARR